MFAKYRITNKTNNFCSCWMWKWGFPGFLSQNAYKKLLEMQEILTHFYLSILKSGPNQLPRQVYTHILDFYLIIYIYISYTYTDSIWSSLSLQMS